MKDSNYNNKINTKKLYNILTPEEKELLDMILEDIGKNNEIYTTRSPEEIINHLLNNCGLEKESIYKLFKKINSISKE